MQAVEGGIVVNGDLSKLKILEAIQTLRLSFDFFSNNASRQSKEKFAIKSWSVKFEEHLMKVTNL